MWVIGRREHSGMTPKRSRRRNGRYGRKKSAELKRRQQLPNEMNNRRWGNISCSSFRKKRNGVKRPERKTGNNVGVIWVSISFVNLRQRQRGQLAQFEKGASVLQGRRKNDGAPKKDSHQTSKIEKTDVSEGDDACGTNERGERGGALMMRPQEEKRRWRGPRELLLT